MKMKKKKMLIKNEKHKERTWKAPKSHSLSLPSELTFNLTTLTFCDFVFCLVQNEACLEREQEEIFYNV